MPEVGITRELSVSEVNQIQHSRNVIIISLLALVFLSAFFFSLRDLSPTYAIGIVFLLGFFLISFINIRTGFLLIVLAFLFSPEINLPFTKFRDLTVRTEDLLVVIVLLAWLGRLALGLQKHFFIYTPLNFPILLCILWNIICSWRGVSAGLVNRELCIFTNLKVIEFFTIYFLIVNNLNGIKEAKVILYVLLITALIVGIYAAMQIPKAQLLNGNRLTAPFEGRAEPNTLGGYLAIFFGIALSIFTYVKRSALKKLCAVILLLLPFPIMFTFARSAYLASIAIVVTLTIISRRKWLLSALIIFLILSPFILPKPVIDRALYNFKDPRYLGFLDPSAAERVYIYPKAWNYITRYTIFGSGVAAENVIDSQYARIVIETGLIGLVLFLWLIASLLKTGIQVFKNTQEGWIKGFSVGFITVVIGMVIHSFVAVSFYIVRIAEPFWALAALAAFLLYSVNTQRDAFVAPGKI